MRIAPHLSARQAARDERGFTLVEMLVTVSLGVVLMLVLFGMLDFSIKQTGRITDRVEVDQQGRVALEKIMQELHSSCLISAETPVRTGSTESMLEVISESGSQASYTEANLHVITFNKSEGTLYDSIYRGTPFAKESAMTEAEKKEAEEGTMWKFPAITSTPTRKVLLLSHVSQSTTGSPEASVPIFQYYRYYNSTDKGGTIGQIYPTPLKSPLNSSDAGHTAEVTVTFNAAPADPSTTTHQSITLTDSALLRFEPSSGVVASNDQACL